MHLNFARHSATEPARPETRQAIAALWAKNHPRRSTIAGARFWMCHASKGIGEAPSRTTADCRCMTSYRTENYMYSWGATLAG